MTDRRTEPLLDTDFLDYFPIRHGLTSSQIGLRRLTADPPNTLNKIFHMGVDWQACLENKRRCRTERLAKYYQHTGEAPYKVCLWMMHTLGREYPEVFEVSGDDTLLTLTAAHTGDKICARAGILDRGASKFVSFANPFDLFDALAMQVPEDLVLQKCLDDYRQDSCVRIHLCHANGWSAEWAINKSFDAIHARIPRIDTIIRDSAKMLKALVESKSAMERLGAVNFRTAPDLNRHPDIPEAERHVPFDHDLNPSLYLRFERQCVVGFAAEREFLFTIRTYRTQIAPTMPKNKWHAFTQLMQAPSDGTNPHRFLELNRTELLSWITDQKT